MSRLVFATASVICKEPLGPQASRRLRHEVDVLRRLAGVDGIVPLADREPWPAGSLLLADVGGRALAEVATPWEPARLVRLAVPLARTVARMHRRGVLHRDINPANILVDERGAPFLTDFALATTFTAIQPEFLHDREIVGTVPYLAPEQTGRTGRLVDQRADLYSLGATLYELATGAPPFGSGDPLRVIHDHLARAPRAASDVNPAVPAALSAIIAHLLEKEPDDRYQSADGLLRDLELVRGGAVVLRAGEHDLPPRRLMPSRLAGRDHEIGELRAVFTEAMAGRCRGLLLAGEAGMGKTSLADELRPIVAAHDGWFVAGKFDQFRRDVEYDGLRRAFQELGRLLLAEPEETLAEVRARMVRALGPNVGLVAASMPELRSLLDADPDPGDPMTALVRAQLSALAILRAVASRERPLVMVVDDLQWAGTPSLGALDMIFSGEWVGEGLLVVGAFRDRDVDPSHPLRPLLARWDRQDGGPRTLRLSRLGPDGQAALVADLLHLPRARAADLAWEIAPSTGGNPYDTVELLNSLRQDGVLTRAAGGWSWEPAVLHGRLARGHLTGALADRLAVLPPGTRRTLAVMACLAGRVELDLLQAATALSSDDLERRLAPASAAGLLVLESDAPPVVRFRHDRVRESVLAGLTARENREIRLVLARRLAGRPEYAIAGAEQYLHVTDMVRDAQERATMVDLFRRVAAEPDVAVGNVMAERFLTAALGSIDPADTACLLDTHVRRHAVLYRLGRLAEADEEFAALARLRAGQEPTAAATAIQISSLAIRGRTEEAFRLGLAALGRLGLNLPDGDRLDAEVDRELDAVYRWAEQSSERDDLRRPRIVDRTRLSAFMLVNHLMAPAIFADQTNPAVASWLIVTAVRMWGRDGPDAALVGPSAWIGLLCIDRRRDYRAARRLVRRIVAVSAARGYEPESWVARFLYAACVGHWFDPQEDNAGLARRTLSALVQAGDLETACYSHYVILMDRLHCAPSLDVYAEDVDEAMAFAARTGNGQAEEVFRSYRQAVRVLRGDAGASAVDWPAPMLLGTNPVVLVHTHVLRALIAAVLDRPAELDRHTAAAMRLLAPYESTQLAVTARVLRILTLARQARTAEASQADTARADLDRLIAWLAARAQDAPVNVGHLLCLAEAERAWAADDFREAACAFDKACREAAARARPWHRALIMERTARFFLAHGMEETAYGPLSAARGQYLDWGAQAKASQLDYAYPDLKAYPDRRPHPGLREEPSAARPLAWARGALAGRGSPVTTGGLDLLGIVAASQALSSETSIGGLRSSVEGILCEMTGATGVHLLLRDSADVPWSVLVAGDATVTLDEAARRRLLAPSVVWYAQRTHGPLIVADATHDERFARDPYLGELKRCSVLAVPIMIRGAPRAMLLLENRLIRGAFTTERLEGIMIIAGQLAVSLDNALVYASLEQRVTERTEQLAAANRRLEQLSVTDPMTGLANRRHLDEVLAAEWRRAERQRTPLGFAMIDIDHFKDYNDHFGHTAGDWCLRRVATVLAAGTRDTDLLARYGGEEFAVVMPGASGPAAARTARRLRAAVADLAEPHPLVAAGIVTVSIGTASVVPTRDDDVSTLVELADAALYRAKAAGRDQVRSASRGNPRRPGSAGQRAHAAP